MTTCEQASDVTIELPEGAPRNNEDADRHCEPAQEQDDDEDDDCVFANNVSFPAQDNSSTDDSAAVVQTRETSTNEENNNPESSSSCVATSLSTVTVSTTRRRPSYTSKAPSALTNLNPPHDTNKVLEATSLPRESLLQVPSTNELSGFIVSHAQRPSQSRANSKDMLNSLHDQASFDESLDDYSNPGTPSSLRTESPSASPNPGQKRSVDQRSRQLQAYANYRTKWEEAAKADVLAVKCRETVAELHKAKLGSGSKGKSIKIGDQWKTPIEFEALAGRGACKDWKRSIRFGGQPLQKLIEGSIITPHAISCTCGICCGDDAITGHVKLFVPYTKAKRRRKDLDSVSQRFSTSIESCEGSKGDGTGAMMRGSIDSDVFTLPHQSSTATDNGEDIAAMPPMTPVTPMTPITPLTPINMSHSYPSSSLAAALAHRSNSPPRNIMLAVPTSLTSMSTSLPGAAAVYNPSNGLTQVPPTSRASLSSSDACKSGAPTQDGTSTMMSQHHWMQLDEMANNILSMANQLKILVAQANVQAEASKEAAVAQAKLQAENEKREALNQVRLQSLAHMSQVFVNVQRDKSESGSFDSGKSAVCKLCQNCGREALLECTGCCRVFYCGNYCQRRDWNNHQRFCRENAIHQMASET